MPEKVQKPPYLSNEDFGISLVYKTETHFHPTRSRAVPDIKDIEDLPLSEQEFFVPVPFPSLDEPLFSESSSRTEIAIAQTYSELVSDNTIRVKPTAPPSKVLSAEEAVPPLVKLHTPTAKQEKLMDSHYDWHEGQQLYVSECPLCQVDPRFKPDNQPTTVVPVVEEPLKSSGSREHHTVSIQAGPGRNVYIGSFPLKEDRYARRIAFEWVHGPEPGNLVHHAGATLAEPRATEIRAIVRTKMEEAGVPRHISDRDCESCKG